MPVCIPDPGQRTGRRVIRVLVGDAAHADRESRQLELLVRSIASLEFAGAFDVSQLTAPESAGDVLLGYFDERYELDLAALADLPIPVVLLMHSSDTAAFSSALRLGIRGILSPDATADELESAVRAVCAGLTVTTPALLAGILPIAEIFTDEPTERLSEREREVLNLVAEGLSNKLIGHGLNISEHTVKTHIASIFAKLGVSSRTEAVSQAIRRGLVML